MQESPSGLRAQQRRGLQEDNPDAGRPHDVGRERSIGNIRTFRRQSPGPGKADWAIGNGGFSLLPPAVCSGGLERRCGSSAEGSVRGVYKGSWFVRLLLSQLPPALASASSGVVVSSRRRLDFGPVINWSPYEKIFILAFANVPW
ncbi:hypothetical protein ColLi_12569 [Colletotrichum liriopes]|uniref:Uncharacterized protein n=1 Tax=Colletotrichum liriopes TaxID=708192 RepID=A0AA37GYM0_9PEZI|nr:hypothetical protein ColLi_12569 [Colletotrichum liriopes]